MAGELIGGALLGNAVSKSSSFIIQAINKTRHFKSQLKEMKNTVQRLRPLAEQIDKLNKELDRPMDETKMLINLLNKADGLVMKCEHIKLNLSKRYRHASKLNKMNKSLLNFVQLDIPVQNARDTKEILTKVTRGLEKGSSSAVPSEKCVVIGFEDRVRDLTAMVLKDSPDGDCSVVVVSAAGGCGKTTLVTKLCHRPDIRRKYGDNIYYVTVSRTYDLKVVIKKLLGTLRDVTSDEDAIQQWGSFLGANKSEILLVLDDVWSASIITKLKFKSPGYKILATSRIAFTQFKTYQLQVLNDQDATNLFTQSALSEHSNIPHDLVVKLVKCCKNHPMALSVIGSLLKGTRAAKWEVMFRNLSEKNKSFSNLDKSIQHCLEQSLYFFNEEPKMKECYIDLGLFPEDQKIAAIALLDIWSHLYNHDEEGLDTMDILDKLSSRNLATLLPKRKHLPAIANHCEEEFVVQHDMMRDLAIHLSNEESVEHRERLIINSDGQDLPVNARILSISTDERLYSTWNEIQVSKVEVFVLNFMSKMHPLTQFMQNMERLKVLIITNYGYYFSEIQNFPAPQYLSSLTTIRLDHVSISSISTTILMLKNLQKLSLIMCKIGNSFNEGIPSKLTSLLEIDIDSCDDLVTFPAILCNLVCLKKLSITNCHELTSISEEFGNLSNLEVVRVSSCTSTKLTTLPESVRNLKKLRIIDISHCLHLQELPQHIGELVCLETIDATGCTGLQEHELPKSIKDFDNVRVFCDEETLHLWSVFNSVKVEVVQEDALDTFNKIISRGHI